MTIPEEVYRRVRIKKEFSPEELKSGTHVLYNSTDSVEGSGEALGIITKVLTQPCFAGTTERFVDANEGNPHYLIRNERTHKETPFSAHHIINAYGPDIRVTSAVNPNELKPGARVLYHPAGKKSGLAIGKFQRLITGIERVGTKPHMVCASEKDPWAFIENEHTRIQTPFRATDVVQELGSHVLDENLHETDLKAGMRVMYRVKESDGSVKEYIGKIVKVHYPSQYSTPEYHMLNEMNSTEHVVHTRDIVKLFPTPPGTVLEVSGKMNITNLKPGTRVLYHPGGNETTGIVKHLMTQPEMVRGREVDASPEHMKVLIENDYTRRVNAIPYDCVYEIVEFIE